jgi:EPS-associated MarR family transcriptional regulator
MPKLSISPNQEPDLSGVRPMQDEITYKLLKSIDENPSQSQRELSKSLGISLGKLNYCLKALVDKGLVKANNFRMNPHKADYLYLLTPDGMEEKTKVTLRFLKRKVQEYEQLKQDIEQLQKEAL